MTVFSISEPQSTLNLAIDLDSARSMLRDTSDVAEISRPCALGVISLIAGVVSFLGLGVFITTLLFSPSSYLGLVGSLVFVVPMLSVGIVVGILALNKAHKGFALRGGDEVAIAGIVINTLPALFVIIWFSIAVLPNK
jgi:hypothetical protein